MSTFSPAIGRRLHDDKPNGIYMLTPRYAKDLLLHLYAIVLVA